MTVASVQFAAMFKVPSFAIVAVPPPAKVKAVPVPVFAHEAETMEAAVVRVPAHCAAAALCL